MTHREEILPYDVVEIMFSHDDLWEQFITLKTQDDIDLAKVAVKKLPDRWRIVRPGFNPTKVVYGE